MHEEVSVCLREERTFIYIPSNCTNSNNNSNNNNSHDRSINNHHTFWNWNNTISKLQLRNVEKTDKNYWWN